MDRQNESEPEAKTGDDEPITYSGDAILISAAIDNLADSNKLIAAALIEIAKKMDNEQEQPGDFSMDLSGKPIA